MTQKAVKTATPHLNLVEEEPLILGPLTPSYESLERQEVVDYASSLATDESPEWASGETVLALSTASGGTILATLDTTDPDIAPEAVILPSKSRKASQGISTLVVVEGTVDALLAATFAVDIDVVCVPTPNQLTKDAVASVNTLAKGKKVVLLFATSPAISDEAHTRATEVTDALKMAGVSSVTILLPPNGSLAAYLNPLPDPSLALPNVLATTRHIKSIATTTRQTTRPIATFRNGQLQLPPMVSTMLGHIVIATPEQYDDEGKPKHNLWQPLAGYVDGQKIYATSTLINCAPVVERVITTVDDLATRWEPTTSYQLAVQVGPATRAVIARVTVATKELQTPLAWIDRLGGKGAEIEFGEQGVGNGGTRIAAAIKGTITHTTPKATHFKRTGIALDDMDVPRWVDSGGGHGPDDKTDTVASAVLPDVNIPAASMFDIVTIQRSAREWIEAAELADPTVWVTGLAATFFALSGMHPKAVLYYVGLQGSGKSYLVGLLASCLGRKYGPDRSMYKPESTGAAMRELIETAHNLPVWIDDVRDRDTQTEQIKQDAAIELAIRAGSEGGAAVAARQELTAGDPTWHTKVTRDSRPFVCITGEQLPNERNSSSTERLLAVDIDRATSIAPGKKPQLDEMYARRAWTPAVAAFLRERMRAIQEEHGGDLEAARLALQAATQKRADAALAALEGVSPRTRDVTWTFLAGVIVFLDFCVQISILTEAEATSLYRRWAKLILKAAQRHATDRLSSATKGDQVLSHVRSRISQGKAILGASDGHTPSIGVVTNIGGTGRGGKSGGTPHIALIASAVQEIARSEMGITHGVNQMMKSVVIDGRPDRQVKINGEVVPAYVIRRDKYQPPGENEVEEEEEEAPATAQCDTFEHNGKVYRPTGIHAGNSSKPRRSR